MGDRCVSQRASTRSAWWPIVLAASVVAAWGVAACGGSGQDASSEAADTQDTSDTADTAGTAEISDSADTEGDAMPLACTGTELPTVGAIDLATGEVRWLVCSTDELWRSMAGATDDIVIVSEAGEWPDGATVVLSATDGSEQWRIAASRAASELPLGPVAGGGVVIRNDQTGALVGLDVADGSTRWALEGPMELLGQGETVAVVTPTLDVGGQPPTMRGIDRATGEQVWRSSLSFSDLSGRMVARGPAAVWDDAIAVPTGDTLTAFDLATGTPLWQAVQTDHPDAADGAVVGTFGNGPSAGIRALDASTGEELWTAPGVASYGDLIAVGDGVAAVMLPDTGEVVAYELTTGAERWRVDPVGAQPQAIVGTTLVLLWEGVIAAMSTADGSTIWSLDQPFGSDLMNNVALTGSTVYVALNTVDWRD